MTRRLKLKITNVNPEPMEGTAALELPRGWRGNEAVSFGPLAGGGSLELTLPIEIPADAAKNRYDVWCRIKTLSGDFKTYKFHGCKRSCARGVSGGSRQLSLVAQEPHEESVCGDRRLFWAQIR